MRTFPLNSHPGHFSRVRQSKNFLISRTPCVSCRNNRIFSLRIVNSFLRLFFHTFRPRPHVSGYFWKRRFLCPLSKKNASLIFRPNWGPKGPKKIFGDRPPPYLRVWMTAPPPPLIRRSESTTEDLFIWARLTGLARLPGWILPWVHMRNFSPVSEMRKGQRSWVRVLAPNLGNKANIAKHKNFNLRAYLSIGNS